MTYPAQSIVQTRSKDTKEILPKAPTGIAEPKGWRLEDQQGKLVYVREG